MLERVAHPMHYIESMTFAQFLSVILLGGSVLVAAFLHATEPWGADHAESTHRRA